MCPHACECTYTATCVDACPIAAGPGSETHPAMLTPLLSKRLSDFSMLLEILKGMLGEKRCESQFHQLQYVHSFSLVISEPEQSKVS